MPRNTRISLSELLGLFATKIWKEPKMLRNKNFYLNLLLHMQQHVQYITN